MYLLLMDLCFATHSFSPKFLRSSGMNTLFTQRMQSSTYLGVLASISKTIEALRENMLLKAKLAELEDPTKLPSSALSIGQNRDLSSSILNAAASDATEPNTMLKNKGRYVVTSEEKEHLDDLYSSLSHIPPHTLSRMLAGRMKTSAPTYQDTLKCLAKKGMRDFDYYKNLHWKLIRISGKSSYDRSIGSEDDASIDSGGVSVSGENFVKNGLKKEKTKTRLAQVSAARVAKIVSVKKKKANT